MLRRIDDPTEGKWIAASAVGDFLGINSAAYGGVDDREQFLTIDRAYRHGISGIEWVGPLNDLGPDVVAELRAGRTVTIEDARADARGRAAALAQRPIGNAQCRERGGQEV